MKILLEVELGSDITSSRVAKLLSDVSHELQAVDGDMAVDSQPICDANDVVIGKWQVIEGSGRVFHCPNCAREFSEDDIVDLNS